MHHLPQTELSRLAQLFSVFFNGAPELIAFKGSEAKVLYEVFIHLLCMLCHVLKNISYGISVVPRYPFNAAYTILLNQVLTDVYDLVLREVLVIQWCIGGLDKPVMAVVAVVLLMPCTILASFHYVFPFLLQVIAASGILARYIYFAPWSCHFASQICMTVALF